MVPPTRRHVLRGAAGALLVGLGGCSGSSSSTVGSPANRQGNVEADPPAVSLRTRAGESAAWLPPTNGSTTSRSGVTSAASPNGVLQRGFVASQSDATRLQFAPGVDGVADVRAFLDATDYATETVYFEARPVRACYELDLCAVRWTPNSVHTSYGSYYRDADVACTAGETDRSTWFVRLPAAIDPGAVDEWGSGWSSTGCPVPRSVAENRTSGGPVDAGPLPANGSGGTGR